MVNRKNMIEKLKEIIKNKLIVDIYLKKGKGSYLGFKVVELDLDKNLFIGCTKENLQIKIDQRIRTKDNINLIDHIVIPSEE